MVRVTYLIILFFWVGCASTPPTRIEWNKPGGTRQDYDIDLYQCIQESRVSWAAGGSGSVGLFMMMGARQNAQNQADELFKMCMRSRGWTDRVIEVSP